MSNIWENTWNSVTKGYIMLPMNSDLSNLYEVRETEEYYDEGMGGWVRYKVYRDFNTGLEYITSDGWIFQNP